MNVLRTIPFSLILGLLAGCDIVNDPIPPAGSGGGGGGEGVTRRVLLEDMTGHTCNNCPGAARIAQDLQAIYGEELVLVGVHCGSFSNPVAPIGDGVYDTDFRTPAGNDYRQAFQVTFFPAGLVSRRPFNGSVVVSEGSWSTAVADIIGEPSPFDLWFDTLEQGSGTVSTTVRLRLTETVQGDHNLIVYLTEDHVVDWQTDSEASPPDVPDYDHRHVLRTNLNGTWGTPMITGTAAAGDTITLNFDNFALDPAWNTANLALVAYLYDTSTDEVMQVTERKFQP
ncbi:MAG: Omp28-related outer membrane protein [Flavobacteriales bacterium]|nr:Omp28-related outer membrane protein [Flavobacteriales bacterium]